MPSAPWRDLRAGVPAGSVTAAASDGAGQFGENLCGGVPAHTRVCDALPVGQGSVAEILPSEGMIDVHTYARVCVQDRWVRIDLAFPDEPWDGRSDMRDPWGGGDDFEAGTDPIAHKESLIAQLGDPALRARFIEAISR
jgi:hypothetical protein